MVPLYQIILLKFSNTATEQEVFEVCGKSLANFTIHNSTGTARPTMVFWRTGTNVFTRTLKNLLLYLQREESIVGLKA
jgi:hypothetical protein